MVERQIDRALAWDAAHPDPETPQARFPAERRAVRDGLIDLRRTLVEDADEIRAQRRANGLENR